MPWGWGVHTRLKAHLTAETVSLLSEMQQGCLCQSLAPLEKKAHLHYSTWRFGMKLTKTDKKNDTLALLSNVKSRGQTHIPFSH